MKTAQKLLFVLGIAAFMLNASSCTKGDENGFKPGSGYHPTEDPVLPPEEPVNPEPPVVEDPVIPEEEQDATIVGNPIDSRWEVKREESENAEFSWVTEGICYASAGEGKDKASISVHSANDSRFNYSILSSNSKNAIAVSGLKKDDYILFRVPMENLAAGTDIDFITVVNVSGNDAPKDYIFEYYEDGKWHAVGSSIEIKYNKTFNHVAIFKSFTTGKAVEKRGLRMRLRVSSRSTSTGSISQSGSTGSLYFGPETFMVARVLAYPAEKFPAVTDSKKIMALGNSYTYFYGTSWLLKEIARSQGHQLELSVSCRDGYGLNQHLNQLPLSQSIINKGGYDYAILQDQSTQHSTYATGLPNAKKEILDNTKAVKDAILAKSPSCHIILENTWASGSTSSQNLINGCKALAEAADIPGVSPICAAFDAAKGSYSLFYTDGHHPGPNGAYLKACVNYLVLYKTKFDEKVSNGGLDAEIAAGLRRIAEDTVLGTEE